VRRALALVVLLAALGAAAFFCVVILDEREQGFRTLLNDPDFRVAGLALNRPLLDQPGWYLRIPGLHQLYRYERRLLRYDAEPRELYTQDKLLIQVDYYALWRIEDARLFFQKLRTYEDATRRIDTVTYSDVRSTLGQSPLSDLLSAKRAEVMRAIAQRADAELRPQGIRIVDLRLRGSDYPESNLPGILERMRSERQRFALRYRAEGDEASRSVRSGADRESQVLRAEASGQAQRIRGEGDARAAEIYAQAFGQAPEFYAFVRSLEAYRRSLDAHTTLVLSPKSPFLRYLFEGASAPGAAAGATRESP
jgi:membrane protease subunit HflC